MSYRYQRVYAGRVQGVILDWSGTTIDYGCMAPTMVFVEVFKAFGVTISPDEARGPMGTYKRDHLRQLTQLPGIAARWQDAHGRLPTEDDVQALFDAFIPRQIAIIADYADVIPGVRESVADFRARGLKIGSTTGYTHAMMDVLLPRVRANGYEPDMLVCPDDAPTGRPAPWMAYLNAIRLKLYPMESLVKFGDTLADIDEGLNAGMWTVGLAKSGNMLGLSEAEAAALDPQTLAARLAGGYEAMYRAGAHYVIDSLADASSLIDQIEARLARGEKP